VTEVRDIAFSPSVKALQTRMGSRAAYAAARDWLADLTEELAGFIAAQTSAFLATVNADGQPYIQHRGGPPGFLRVLDPRTIAFADFAGNRQYVSWGNLSDTPKAHLFLIDYATRQRVKLWGHAEMSEDPDLIAQLMPDGYRARPERALVFHLQAWDANCPQHIPMRVAASDVAEVIAAKDARIAELEAALALVGQSGRSVDRLPAKWAIGG
jgi:uncharacterized protein